MKNGPNLCKINESETRLVNFYSKGMCIAIGVIL